MKDSNFIFLITFSGSGSKLLQSQLSNSKEIFTIPAYPLLYYYSHFNEWKKKYKDKLDKKKILSLILKHHASLIDTRKIRGFNGLNTLGKNKKNFIKLPKKKFKKEFLNYLSQKKITNHEVAKAIHYSYQKCLDDKKKKYLFHVHWLKYLNNFVIKDFTKSKIICNVRHPIYNFWRRVHADENLEKIRFDYTDFEHLRNYRYINRLRNFNINFQNINSNFKSKNLKFIRFEDLKNDNISTLKSICKFLKVSFNYKNMKDPKFFNKKWWGDKVYKGYSNKNNFVKSSFNYESELKSFNKYELIVLEKVLYPYMKKFRYTKKNYRPPSFFKFFCSILLPTKHGLNVFFSRLNFSSIAKYLKASFFEAFSNIKKNYYFNAMYKFKWSYKINRYILKDPLRKKIFYNKKKFSIFNIIYFLNKIFLYFFMQFEIAFLYFFRIYLILSIFINVKKKIKYFNFSY